MVTNPFHSMGGSSQRYALDIVKLNRGGNRAAGIYPKELSAYAIYAATIYSPCDGEVIEARDGVADNNVGDVNTREPIGNHIEVRGNGVKVTIGHMMNGSVLVKNGQLLKKGQAVGEVGNSGFTAEPHIHIQAVKDVTVGSLTVEEQVPISFDGRMISLNSVVTR